MVIRVFSTMTAHHNWHKFPETTLFLAMLLLIRPIMWAGVSVRPLKRKDILWNETFVKCLWLERTIMHMSLMEFPKGEVTYMHLSVLLAPLIMIHEAAQSGC